MMKHYFLMDQGDYIVHLMDIAEDELKKDSKSVNIKRLQSLLELSIRSGSFYIPETFKDDLKCTMSSTSLVEQLLKILNVTVDDPSSMSLQSYSEKPLTVATLSGFEAFTLNIDILWPLNLILNRKAIIKYQMLSRQLFYCKYIERLLSHVWANFQRLKIHSNTIIVGPLAKSLMLRHKMFHFIQHVQNHLASLVIDQNWDEFLSKQSQTSTIDELLQFHADFLDICLKQSMLTHAKLLKILGKLFHVCVLFSQYMHRFSRLFFMDHYESISHTAKSHSSTDSPHRTHLDRLLTDESFDRSVTKFEENFMHHLRLFMDGLRFYSSADCEGHMLSLLNHLDYNLFFTMVPSQHTSSFHRGVSSFTSSS
jgi:gamma-tubulin complex component 2